MHYFCSKSFGKKYNGQKDKESKRTANSQTGGASADGLAKMSLTEKKNII
jgi:hypothetical protein